MLEIPEQRATPTPSPGFVVVGLQAGKTVRTSDVDEDVAVTVEP
jgi:hypothetical protein